MGFFNTIFTKSRNKKSQTGFTNYDDVINILEDNIDQLSEFYEIEPAFVKSVLLEPKDLPLTDGPNGNAVPDYSYYGSITAQFVGSQSEGDLISGTIKPLSPHIIVYPTVDEVVNVAKHGGQYYYYTPLNLSNKVNMNLADGKTGNEKIKESSTEFNRPIFAEEGDVVINGRFGNGVKFGSDPSFQYPEIKITNRQAVLPSQKIDDHIPHPQGINTDGSSIWMTSGAARKEDSINPAAESQSIPGVLDGDMITISSDKLVFNAKGVGKGTSTIEGNQGDIHMFAREAINLSANQEINIDLGKGPFGRLTFGDAAATNPMLKGNQTEEVLTQFVSSIVKFVNALAKKEDTIITPASKTLSSQLGEILKNLKTIKSDFVFIGENFKEKKELESSDSSELTDQERIVASIESPDGELESLDEMFENEDFEEVGEVTTKYYQNERGHWVTHTGVRG